MHEKLRPNAREWTKAAVDKEVDIRSHQVCTEDGWLYIQKESQTSQAAREPFLTMQFVEFSTKLSRQRQSKGVVPSGNVSASEAPTRKPTSEVPTTEPVKHRPGSLLQKWTSSSSGGIVVRPCLWCFYQSDSSLCYHHCWRNWRKDSCKKETMDCGKQAT